MKKEAISLKFLIIHESIIIRNIIRNYIAADYGEAAADLCISSEKSLHLLETEKYDAVLSGMEMAGMNGVDLFNYMQGSDCNRETPMIIMTSADFENRQNRLTEHGNQYILPIPCTFARFRILMYEVFHPDRSGQRNIPKPGAVILTGHRMIPADIIRISGNSIVFELSEAPVCLTKPSEITVRFSADYGSSGMIHLTGDLLNQIAEFEITDEFSEQNKLRMIWKLRWKHIELSTAVHQPVKILDAGRYPDPDEKRENISSEHISLSKENENLKTDAEAFRAEKDDLLKEISELRKQLSEIGKTRAEISANKIPLNALTGEGTRRSDDPAKSSLFRRIIAENVRLREGN